jgi:hypothetical protein
MKLIHIGVALTLAAALPALTAQAGEHRKASREAGPSAKGMQVVAVAPAPGEPGHGWQYFSDSRKARAVVISPNGDYYYSRGHGMKLVFKSPTAV